MKKILLFGDSNTWGHNPADMTQLPRTWGKVAAELLPECEITIDGECGRATKLGEGAKNGIAAFRERYLQGVMDFDLIAIMLGTNDVLNGFFSKAEETARTLSMYIEQTREMYGDKSPEFMIISPILVRESVLGHPIFMELYSQKSIEESKRFAGAMSDMAQREGAYFMNAADYAAASDIDGVHMETAEHEKLGHAVTDKLKEIFDL